jgi:competence protein ComEC
MKNHNFTSPLFIPLLGLIIGIYCAATWYIPLSIILTAFVLILPLAYISRKSHSILVTAILIVFFCIGAFVLWAERKNRDLVLPYLQNRPITLIGTIADKDEWIQNKKHGESIRLAVSEIFEHPNKHHHVSCDILCYVKRKTKFMVGDVIAIKDVFIKPQKDISTNGNPTYNDYLLKEHIACSIFLPSAYLCNLIQRPNSSIKRWIWQTRHNMYKAIINKLSPLATKYFGLIFLGQKQHESIDQIRTTFNYWGLAHYLARAGLHIVLFIFIWMFFLSLIPIHIQIKRVLLILLCIVYDLFSWSSIPFARAFYSFLLTKLGELTNQQTTFIHILSLMCLTILLFNPMQLFFLDFQLTFGLTFTLSLVSRLIAHHKKQTEIVLR